MRKFHQSMCEDSWLDECHGSICGFDGGGSSGGGVPQTAMPYTGPGMNPALLPFIAKMTQAIPQQQPGSMPMSPISPGMPQGIYQAIQAMTKPAPTQQTPQTPTRPFYTG